MYKAAHCSESRDVYELPRPGPRRPGAPETPDDEFGRECCALTLKSWMTSPTECSGGGSRNRDVIFTQMKALDLSYLSLESALAP